MSNLKIACCMLTLDRNEVTKKTTLENIKTAGMDVDLFVHDNASKDWQSLYVDLFNTRRLVHYQRSETNIGVAKAFNQLIKKATDNGYNMVVLIGNDIANGEGWLKAIHDYAIAIPESGLIALDWGCGANPKTPSEINGLPVVLCDGVFGVMGLTPKVLDKVGYFNEDYFPYGFEDSDYNHRVRFAGYQSYYLPNITSKHIMQDVGEKTEYREMKDLSLHDNGKKYEENIMKYQTYNKYYIGSDGKFELPANPADIDPENIEVKDPEPKQDIKPKKRSKK